MTDRLLKSPPITRSIFFPIRLTGGFEALFECSVESEKDRTRVGLRALFFFLGLMVLLIALMLGA